MLTELVPPADGCRRFEAQFRAGFADCSPSGRMRLDAIARWLQEIAYADVESAGLHFHAVWVVRRTRLSIRRFPRFAEPQVAVTFCGGLGRMWAERRTTIGRPDAAQSDVEAVSLWVHLAPGSWRPSVFSAEELAIYGDGLPQRRVTARLRHPGPQDASERGRWHFRATECDIAGHINNAVYLQVVEEELLAGPEEPGPLEVEIEYRSPAQPGEKLVLENGPRRWITGLDGDLHAAAVIFSSDSASP